MGGAGVVAPAIHIRHFHDGAVRRRGWVSRIVREEARAFADHGSPTWRGFPCIQLVAFYGRPLSRSRRGAGMPPMTPNSALLTDAFSSLRCACSAAKRER